MFCSIYKHQSSGTQVGRRPFLLGMSTLQHCSYHLGPSLQVTTCLFLLVLNLLTSVLLVSVCFSSFSFFDCSLLLSFADTAADGRAKWKGRVLLHISLWSVLAFWCAGFGISLGETGERSAVSSCTRLLDCFRPPGVHNVLFVAAFSQAPRLRMHSLCYFDLVVAALQCSPFNYSNMLFYLR